MTHGDELDSALKCGGWLTGMFGDWRYDMLLFANRWTNRLRRRLNYPYWSLANFLKRPDRAGRRLHRPFRSRRRARGPASGLRRRDLRAHPQGGTADIGGVCYANDGDWVESCTALVEHQDGRLEVLHWAEEAARRQVWTATETELEAA